LERGSSQNKDCQEVKIERLALQCLALANEMKFEDIGGRKNLFCFFETGPQGSIK